MSDLSVHLFHKAGARYVGTKKELFSDLPSTNQFILRLLRQMDLSNMKFYSPGSFIARPEAWMCFRMICDYSNGSEMTQWSDQSIETYFAEESF